MKKTDFMKMACVLAIVFLGGCQTLIRDIWGV